MSAAAEMAETRLRMLGELAELGLVLARDLQQSALVAEDTQEKARLADAFARVSRGVRQSLALHDRLERDDRAEAQRQEPQRRARRTAEVRRAVAASIWREQERLDADPDQLLEELDLHLAAESETDAFLEQDADAVIARLCRALGLSLPAAADGPADPAPAEGAAPPATLGGRATAAALRHTAARATGRRWLSSA
jgi:hypothetical protein